MVASWRFAETFCFADRHRCSIGFSSGLRCGSQSRQAYRRMGAEARVRIGFSMSEDVRAIAAQGTRSRHPDYAETQVRSALFRLLYGDELTRAVWPGEA